MGNLVIPIYSIQIDFPIVHINSRSQALCERKRTHSVSGVVDGIIIALTDNRQLTLNYKKN